MNHYRAGRDKEYKVRDHLADNGYEIIRAAGSKGKVDLVAFKAWAHIQPAWMYAHMLFVQVKRTGGTIPPADRAELIRLAGIARALPIVAYQPLPRRPLQYRRLTGPGPKDWQPWTPDEVAP
jgi:Holliday junction resolvase